MLTLTREVIQRYIKKKFTLTPTTSEVTSIDIPGNVFPQWVGCEHIKRRRE